MISVSKKSEYGLRAVLVLAAHYGQQLVQIKDIAGQENIPRQYLEQILNHLGKAGVIRSVRGKKGGYQLAKPPADVAAAEIIVLLEGGIELAAPANDPTDIVYDLFKNAEKRLLKSLDVSLAELLSRQQQRRNIPSYSI